MNSICLRKAGACKPIYKEGFGLFKTVRYLISSLLLFLYIFEFPTEQWGLPSFITSRRIAVTILAFLVFARFLIGKHKNDKTNNNGLNLVFLNRFIVLNCFLLFYTLILYVAIGGIGNMVYEDIVKLLLFGIVPVFLFVRYFADVDEFVNCLLIAIFVQSLVICLCLADPAFASSIDELFVAPEAMEYVALHRTQYAGGIACITAPGLFKFSIGLIACTYKIMKTKRVIFMALYLYLSLIATMISRTGLFVSIAGLMIIVAFFVHSNNVAWLLKTLIALSLLFFLGVFLLEILNLSDFVALRLARFGKLKNGLKAGFFDGYFYGKDNSYPPFDLRTIIGTGIVSGESNNGVTIYADGGFVRLFAAFGLPLCILFYCFFFYMIFKLSINMKRHVLKYTLFYFFLVFLMGEFKEYTIFKEYMVCIFFTMCFLEEKKLLKKENCYYEKV